MSFDKYYPNRKDWRKSYRGAGSFDRSCRTGGSCSYCIGNRTHKKEKQAPIFDDEDYQSPFGYLIQRISNRRFKNKFHRK